MQIVNALYASKNYTLVDKLKNVVIDFILNAFSIGLNLNKSLCVLSAEELSSDPGTFEIEKSEEVIENKILQLSNN